MEMIQLLQTSWEDRFRVSRGEGWALGSLLRWFSLRRPALQSSFGSSSIEKGGKDGAKLTRPLAKGLKKKQDLEDPDFLYSALPVPPPPQTHTYTLVAWL